MPKVIPKNIADEMTKPYIDDAVEKQIQAADVPPRNKLDISFKDAGRTDDNKDYESNQDAYEKNHGKLYDMTHNNTIPWKNYVVYLVLLSLLTTVFTFSKYMSATNVSGSSVQVAAFDYSITGTIEGVSVVENNMAESTVTILNDEVKKYDFTVSNKSNVAVAVTSKASDYDGFFVSFTDNNNQSLSVPFSLEPNSSKVVRLVIRNNEDSDIDSAKMKLEFLIDQID